MSAPAVCEYMYRTERFILAKERFRFILAKERFILAKERERGL